MRLLGLLPKPPGLNGAVAAEPVPPVVAALPVVAEPLRLARFTLLICALYVPCKLVLLQPITHGLTSSSIRKTIQGLR